jgi:hypothetical protein
MQRTIFATPLMCCLASAAFAQDRFTDIIDGAADSTVTSGGFIVNQKRAATQAEIAKRPTSSSSPVARTSSTGWSMNSPRAFASGAGLDTVG